MDVLLGDDGCVCYDIQAVVELNAKLMVQIKTLKSKVVFPSCFTLDPYVSHIYLSPSLFLGAQRRRACPTHHSNPPHESECRYMNLNLRTL